MDGAIRSEGVLTLVDLAGNQALFTQISAPLTAGSSVTVDKTLPVVSALTIASNQVGNTGYARSIHQITMTLTASETIASPTSVSIFRSIQRGGTR